MSSKRSKRFKRSQQASYGAFWALQILSDMSKIDMDSPSANQHLCDAVEDMNRTRHQMVMQGTYVGYGFKVFMGEYPFGSPSKAAEWAGARLAKFGGIGL